MLGVKQHAFRVHRQSLRIAVAIAPNLRNRSRGLHKWVITWHRTIFIDSINLSVRLTQILSQGTLSTFSGRKEHVSLAIKNNLSTKVHTCTIVILVGNFE